MPGERLLVLGDHDRDLLITNQLLYQLSYAGRWRAARGTSATRNRLS